MHTPPPGYFCRGYRSLLYVFTLLCFTTALVHTASCYCRRYRSVLYVLLLPQLLPLTYCYCRSYCPPATAAATAADTLLCFTTTLVHTGSCYCRSYRSQDKQRRWFRSALLCFTLLYSTSLRFTTAADTGRKTNKGVGFALLDSALLCFTLLYSASLLRIQVARQRLPPCWRSAARLRPAGLRP